MAQGWSFISSSFSYTHAGQGNSRKKCQSIKSFFILKTRGSSNKFPSAVSQHPDTTFSYCNPGSTTQPGARVSHCGIMSHNSAPTFRLVHNHFKIREFYVMTFLSVFPIAGMCVWKEGEEDKKGASPEPL